MMFWISPTESAPPVWVLAPGDGPAGDGPAGAGPAWAAEPRAVEGWSARTGAGPEKTGAFTGVIVFGELVEPEPALAFGATETFEELGLAGRAALGPGSGDAAVTGGNRAETSSNVSQNSLDVPPDLSVHGDHTVDGSERPRDGGRS